MDEIKRAQHIRDGIEELEAASGERLTALEFVRATLGANLDKFTTEGVRNNANLRQTVRVLVTYAIDALEELGEIPPGLEVIAVTQGKLHFVIYDKESKRVVSDFEDYDEARRELERLLAKGRELDVS